MSNRLRSQIEQEAARAGWTVRYIEKGPRFHAEISRGALRFQYSFPRGRTDFRGERNSVATLRRRLKAYDAPQPA